MFKTHGKKRNLWLAAACMVLMCASEAAAETAVADVARIIDTSLPGKAAQAFVDGLRRRLDAEIKEYAEKIRTSSNVEALLAQKCAEAEAAYNAEMSRVSAMLMDALRSVAQKWLKGNKRGVTVIVPSNGALASSPGADVSDELRRLLDRVSIDFAKTK